MAATRAHRDGTQRMLDEKTQGALNAKLLHQAIEQGIVTLAKDAGASQVQPSSIDLTLGAKAYRVRASFLPGKDKTVTERLGDGIVMHELDLTEGAVLEKGCVYLVELRERLSLWEAMTGLANPKSSTGRLDVFVRMVTDYATMFETASPGYKGPLWIEISPRTFSIKVREGSSLNQIRLRQNSVFLSDSDLVERHKQNPVTAPGALFKNGLCMTVELSGARGGVIGYRARRHSGLIDVDQVGALDPREYWEAITAPEKGFIILDPGEFYILASKEWCAVPSDLAAEMTPIDPLLGEFRVHYAGFFDPGFGLNGADGASGSRAVLEVRGHDAPFIIEDGQLVARLVYERLAGPCDYLYGDNINSNYQGQGLKLSKHFRSW